MFQNNSNAKETEIREIIYKFCHVELAETLKTLRQAHYLHLLF